MRTLVVLLSILVVTPPLALLVIIAGMLGVKDGHGSVYDWVPRVWSRALLFVAGVDVRVHNPDRMARNSPRVYVSNHVSWFDVFALASILPLYKFVAKHELSRIPIFGPAITAAGMIFVDRENRKQAFAGYEKAAQRIRDGASVVVCPEGTRGTNYALREFKKGPFVLAIASGVPVVPTLIHGTREIQRRESFRVRAGRVQVHFLEPIETTGMSYEDRGRLADMTRTAMADVLAREYGVVSENEAPQALSAGV